MADIILASLASYLIQHLNGVFKYTVSALIHISLRIYVSGGDAPRIFLRNSGSPCRVSRAKHSTFREGAECLFGPRGRVPHCFATMDCPCWDALPIGIELVVK